MENIQLMENILMWEEEPGRQLGSIYVDIHQLNVGAEVFGIMEMVH